jgi:hypothetical protein
MMTNEEDLVILHERLTEVRTDVTWIKNEMITSRDARISGRRYLLTWGVALITAVIVPCSFLISGYVKNIDILVALHKPAITAILSGQPIK